MYQMQLFNFLKKTGYVDPQQNVSKHTLKDAGNLSIYDFLFHNF